MVSTGGVGEVVVGVYRGDGEGKKERNKEREGNVVVID
jgi:hypothetical protein